MEIKTRINSEINMKNSDLILDKKSAFSLTEVLIAVVLLGILAAVTIPSLIKKEQNKANVVKLLKFYAALEEAHTYAVIFNGPSSTWQIRNGHKRSLLEIASYYEPSFKITKKCSGNRDCWNHTTYNLPGTQVFTYDSYVVWDRENISYKLADGSNLLIDFYNSNELAFDNKNLYVPIIVFFVDLNGAKKPNRLGRDIFAFGVGKDDQIMPAGIGNKSSSTCSVKNIGASSGNACAYRVISEKAIKY